MAKAGEYSQAASTDLNRTDLLLGTDVSGSSKFTKNFSLGELKDFILTDRNFNDTAFPFHVPVLDAAGEEFNDSGIIVDYTPITSDQDVATNDSDKGVWSIGSDADSSTGYSINVRNYADKYALRSFQDKVVTITSTANGSLPGTIGEIMQIEDDNDGLAKDYSVSGVNWNLKFEFDRNTTGSEWDGVSGVNDIENINVTYDSANSRHLESISIAFAADISLETLEISGEVGNLEDDGVVENPDFKVRGVAEINELKVDHLSVIGQDSDRADLHIHGNVHIDGDDGESLYFGDSDGGNVQMTTDGTNLSFLGSGGITIGEDNALTVESTTTLAATTASSLTVGENYITVDGGTIYEVEPNRQAAGASSGTLASIKIGNKWWNIAEAGQNVALLPGLTQDTAGLDDAQTITALFIANQDANELTFVSYHDITDIASVAAGSTSATVLEANVSDFNDIWVSLTGGQRLYFVDEGASFNPSNASAGDTTTATPGDDSENIIYQVTSFDNPDSGDGTLTLARVGAGTIKLSAEGVEISSIPNNVDAGPIDIVLRLDDDTLAYREFTQLSPSTSIRYVNNGDENVGIQRLTYDGPDHLIDVSVAAQPSIDITARESISSESSSFTAAALHLYVLEAITTASTVTLPAGVQGDRIRFYVTEEPAAAANTWTIITAGTDRLNGSSSDTSLVVNSKDNFEMVFVNAAVGWTIF